MKAMIPMNNFENKQQYIKNIPTIADISFQSIEAKQLYVRLFNLFILLVFIVGSCVGLSMTDLDVVTDYGYIVYIVFSTLFLLISLIVILAFYKIKYAIRDKDILYQKGLLIRKIIIVPFNRVQHCELRQGIIQRYLGLASLKLFTAGGASSDLSIPGIKRHEAENLRDFIIKKTGADEEE